MIEMHHPEIKATTIAVNEDQAVLHESHGWKRGALPADAAEDAPRMFDGFGNELVADDAGALVLADPTSAAANAAALADTQPDPDGDASTDADVDLFDEEASP